MRIDEMSAKKLTSNDETKGIGKTKVKKVPDFNKLHHQWTSRLEQRKALSKKPCTVPLEFDVIHEKGTFGRTTNKGNATLSKAGRGMMEKTPKLAARKSPGPNVKFKANKDALNSILNEEGIKNEVTPPKSYSMYYRAGNTENVFKTPQLPKSVKKTASTVSTSSLSAVKKLPPRKMTEPDVEFEASGEALQGILNEEGIKKDVTTSRHFSMYCRTGQPLNTEISPSNILKSAMKTKNKSRKADEESSHQDDGFEANKDALMSILNEKGISNDAATPKYHSMYCRTGQPLKTPQQTPSVRKSIYYQAATSNPKNTAQMYARQENGNNGRQEKTSTHMSLIKSAVAVPIRNSIYKNYCLSPVVKVTPSPRRLTQTQKTARAQTETALKTASRVCWADILHEEAPNVKDDLPTKLTFDDLDSPCSSKSGAKGEMNSKKVTHQSPVQKFPIFCDKDMKPSSSEKPKKGALCPRSPNVNTPPKSSPRARDILHHNSPLKAVVGSKPRYYCPASPRLEHQVSSATELINKENMSPKRFTPQDKEALVQTDKLKDDVRDLSETLNESVLMYDQLQEEADQLLTADADHVILMQLEKIRAKQQKLLKMEEFFRRKLKCKQNAVADKATKSSDKVEGEAVEPSKSSPTFDKVSSETEETLKPSPEKPADSPSTTSDKQGNEHGSSTGRKMEMPNKHSIPEGDNRKAIVQNDPKEFPVLVEPHKNAHTLGMPKDKGSTFHQVEQEITKGLTQLKTMQTVSEDGERIPDCVTPCKAASTPKHKDITEGLVMPTPVRTSPASPTRRAYYFPAICTPLSMRDMANQPESRRDSLGRSPDTPEDIRDSFSIDKSVDSSVNWESPLPGTPLQRAFNLHDHLAASPTSCASPPRSHTKCPLACFPGTPVQLFMRSPASPVTLRGSLSLAGSINFAKPNTPGRTAGLLLPAAVHRYHDALLDEEVSLYMCRLRRYGHSIYAAEARIQDPVAEVLTIGDEMHFIPVSSDDLLLGFSLQPLEGSAFSVLKTAS